MRIKVLGAFAKLHGYDYLRNLIKPLLDRMFALTVNQSYILEPDKAPEEEVRSNQETIKIFTQAFLHIVCNSAAGMPMYVNRDALCQGLTSCKGCFERYVPISLKRCKLCCDFRIGIGSLSSIGQKSGQRPSLPLLAPSSSCGKLNRPVNRNSYLTYVIDLSLQLWLRLRPLMLNFHRTIFLSDEDYSTLPRLSKILPIM